MTKRETIEKLFDDLNKEHNNKLDKLSFLYGMIAGVCAEIKITDQDGTTKLAIILSKMAIEAGGK